MTSNQRGFSLLEGVLALVIVGVIGFVGWYVWDKNQAAPSQPTQTQQTEAYTRTTTVPDDWKSYRNDSYGFRVAYPADWEIDEGEGMLAETSQASNKNYFSLGFRPMAGSGPHEIQYTVGVTYETMAQAVKFRKDIVTESQTESDSIRFTITNEKYFTYDGYEAVRIDTTSDDGTAPDSYQTEMYISANGRLYKFDTTFHDENAMEDEDVLTVFESLKIE